MFALVTIAIGNTFKEIAKLTHPTLKAYADKIKAEFVIITETKINQNTAHFEKFQLAELLNKYERILFIDSDIIIRPDCPNLFEITPQDKLGIFNEGAFIDRSKILSEAAQIHNIKIDDWHGQYYNTGVMVISRRHKELFKKPLIDDIYHHFEQSYLNLQILKNKIEIHELTHHYNRMAIMDGRTGEHRLNSYIIHYAGILQNVTDIMQIDLKRWEQGTYKIKQHILFGAGARLGDMLCAEPIARYLINHEFPNADITIISTAPRIFAHLSNRAKIMHFNEFKYENDMPYYILNAMVKPEHPIWQFMTSNTMHTIDFMSILCLKRTLSNSNKGIKLSISPEGYSEIYDILNKASTANKLILVHPGRGWPSKTFPKEYWDEIIKQLIKKDYQIGIIGKDTEEGFGTVNVDVPEGVVDFRNLLSLDGLFALVSQAKLLITNESSPLYVAGAFDNYIILIPTCKHPDLLLPWRQNNQYYKAAALYKKLMCQEPSMNPLNLYNYSISEIPPGHNIHEYLPEIKEIIQTADKFMEC